MHTKLSACAGDHPYFLPFYKAIIDYNASFPSPSSAQTDAGGR